MRAFLHQRLGHPAFGVVCSAPMSSSARNETLLLLQSMDQGDPAAAEKLLPMIYDDLRRRASRLMNQERADHTLQATGLINEAFLRLVGREVGATSRQHFVRIAGRSMRQVLVDHARARDAEMRGGGVRNVTLDEGAIARPSGEVLVIDEALSRLAQTDEQLAQIVELRFYGGLTHAEVADALGISLRSVERGWQLARAWLASAIEE